MKKFMALILLSACARYHPTPLSSVDSHPAKPGLAVAAKAFSKGDCRHYLDRNVLAKGYQPVQLYIENNTDHTFLFSPARLSLPTASPHEVATRLHASTLNRIVGFGAASLVASPLFVVPGIIDSVKSRHVNAVLDYDIEEKAAFDQHLLPHTQINVLLFVPIDEVKETLTFTLIDKETHQPQEITTHIR